MPVQPVRYKTWFAAFVLVTVGLGMTSSTSIVRAPDNNSNGAESAMASAAGADSISPVLSASPAAAPPVLADHSASVAATAGVVDVALLPTVDQVIYYWVGWTRGLVRSYWSGPSGMADARLN